MILLSQLDPIRFPYSDLRRLTERAFERCPSPVPYNLIAVRVYPTYIAPYQGRAYNGIPRMRGFVSARAMRYFIAIGLNPGNQYPVVVRADAAGSPELVLGSWQELLVAAVAHEAYHVQQFRKKGTAARHDEREAERWAALAQQEEEHGK